MCTPLRSRSGRFRVAVKDVYQEYKSKGIIKGGPDRFVATKEFFEIVGLPKWVELEKKYTK